MADDRARRPNGLVDYFRATRGPWYSFLFALPVLVGYEVLEYLLKPDWVNGADAVLTRFVDLVAPGIREQALVWITLAAGLVCWRLDVAQRQRAGGDGLKLSWFAGMLVESCIYAVCFGTAVNAIRQAVPGLQMAGRVAGPFDQFTASLGAGIWEELLFRVILLGGLAMLLVRAGKVPPFPAWLVATIFSSLVFSLFHYIGNMADTFSIDSFLFRFVAGLLLATIYAARGFGVAVWTHAIYDLLVMFLHGA